MHKHKKRKLAIHKKRLSKNPKNKMNDEVRDGIIKLVYMYECYVYGTAIEEMKDDIVHWYT